MNIEDHYANILQSERAGRGVTIATETLSVFREHARGWGAFRKHPGGGGLIVPTHLANIVLKKCGAALCTPNNLYLHGAMYEYERCGKNTFVVGKTMQEAFAETDLKGIPTEELNAPFNAFYMSFPGNEKYRTWSGPPGEPLYSITDRSKVDSYGTGWVPYVGAYVVWLGKDLHVQLIAFGGDSEGSRLNVEMLPNSDYTMNYVNTWFTISLDKPDLEGIFSDTQPAVSSLNVMAQAEALIEVDVEDLLKTKVETGNNSETKVITKEGEGILQTSEALSEGRKNTMSIMRIIINTALYITSEKADVSRTRADIVGLEKKIVAAAEQVRDATTGRNRRRGHRELARLHGKWIKTKSIVYIGAEIEKASKQAGSKRQDNGRKAHARIAHWHRYRVGPKKREDGTEIPTEERPTKKVWIPPVWVSGSLPVNDLGREYLIE